MAVKRTIGIERVYHIGIRVAQTERAMAFYAMLGFEIFHDVPNDEVVIIRNINDVEINLITNANSFNDGQNILMDVGVKYAGYTHIALGVDSIKRTIEVLQANNIQITQGPVKMREETVAVFVRDPDLNVLELRGLQSDLNAPDAVAGYTPEN